MKQNSKKNSQFFIELKKLIKKYKVEMKIINLQWHEPDYKTVMPKLNQSTLCIIQHCLTKKQKYVILKHVKENDVTWRLDDGGYELSYDWDVIFWYELPSLRINKNRTKSNL